MVEVSLAVWSVWLLAVRSPSSPGSGRTAERSGSTGTVQVAVST